MTEHEELLIAARYQPTTVGNMVLDPKGGYCNYPAVEILRQRVAELEADLELAKHNNEAHDRELECVIAERDALKLDKNHLILNAEVAMKCIGEMGPSRTRVKAFVMLQDAIASVKGSAA